MSKIDDGNIVLEINEINEFIDNFELERNTGTKALKKKFHKEAVEKRNNYVNTKIDQFNQYKNIIFEEITKRANELIPNNKNEIYNSQYQKLNNLQNLLLFTNNKISNNFKLGFYNLIYSIKEDTSFNSINIVIDKFVNNFNNMNIFLTPNDFSFTMFTKEYFETYFQTKDEIKRKEIFEKIYWECPKIVLEIKQNFIKLLKKYEKQIIEYEKKLEVTLSNENDVDLKNVDEVYSLLRTNYENNINSDEYIILKDFISGKYNIGDYVRESNTRIKIFDSFAKNDAYKELPIDDKLKYKEATRDLYKTLKYIKEYNKYEPILKDLIEKYKEKDNVKGNYTAILKEIDKNDKEREKINKEYLKNCGIGFLAKVNEPKKNIAKVKMNELLDKICTDFDNYDDLKISVNISKEVNDASSIHDLFNMTLSSYSYLVKMLKEINSEEEKINIEEEIDKFIKFIYNPYGKFTEGIFAFNNSNILDIIHNKYILLGLKLDRNRLEKENLDILINDISYINLIQNIEDNNLSIENIKYLCDYNKINPINLDE